MSIWGHRISVNVVAVVAVVLLIGGLLTAGSLTPPSREIVLVARGMAFFAPDDPSTPNPTITVRAGERVRVVLRNEDRGITHDFALPAVREATDMIDWNEESSVVFSAPETPGRYEYTCQPHTLMMRGTLLVVR
jgi:plastocyanin